MASDSRKVIDDDVLRDLLGGLGLDQHLVQLGGVASSGWFGVHWSDERWNIETPDGATEFNHHGDAVLRLIQAMSKEPRCKIDWIPRHSPFRYGKDTAVSPITD